LLGERPVVHVADEGAGIPDALLGRLFDRHVGSPSGGGVGLALARTLVESDAGRLELVQARPPIFELYLVADRDERESRRGQGTPAAGRGRTGPG
jgi:nitrogen-specific signal transduction histidine kinase